MEIGSLRRFELEGQHRLQQGQALACLRPQALPDTGRRQAGGHTDLPCPGLHKKLIAVAGIPPQLVHLLFPCAVPSQKGLLGP